MKKFITITLLLLLINSNLFSYEKVENVKNIFKDISKSVTKNKAKINKEKPINVKNKNNYVKLTASKLSDLVVIGIATNHKTNKSIAILAIKNNLNSEQRIVLENDYIKPNVVVKKIANNKVTVLDKGKEILIGF